MNFELLRQYGWPLIVLLAGAFLSLPTAVLPKARRQPVSAGLALLVFAAAAAGFFLQWQARAEGNAPFLIWDPFGNFLGMLVSLIGFATVLLAYRYWSEQSEVLPEFYLLLQFAVVGMVLMVSTGHLIALVFGIEIMSLSLYVLVAMRRAHPVSSEAAFKYFLLGSVATAFLLFGIAMLYGATGTMDLWKIATTQVAPDRALIFKLGGMLVLLAFAFKVAAAPLHFWAPDVYDGAPVPITGFMATGVKIAAFGGLIRFVQALSGFDFVPLKNMLLFLSLATMLVGNLTALRQRSLKRIMAYSSVSHAGYLLLGTATLLGPDGFIPQNIGPILFYFLSYAILTIGVFAVLTALSSQGREIGELKDLDGLAEKHPVLAAALSVFLISLAGIPPTAGFLAKYYLFLQAIHGGLYLYAILGMLSSAASLYYYLGPVMRMYFRSSEQPARSLALSWATRGLLVLLIAGVFYFGILPGRGVWVAGQSKMSGPVTAQSDYSAP